MQFCLLEFIDHTVETIVLGTAAVLQLFSKNESLPPSYQSFLPYESHSEIEEIFDFSVSSIDLPDHPLCEKCTPNDAIVADRPISRWTNTSEPISNNNSLAADQRHATISRQPRSASPNRECPSERHLVSEPSTCQTSAETI